MNYKHIIGIILFFVAVIVIYLRFRNSPGNNLRRARKYHRIGEKHYNKNNFEDSKLYYEVANEYRERAMEQLEE